MLTLVPPQERVSTEACTCCGVYPPELNWSHARQLMTCLRCHLKQGLCCKEQNG